MPPAREPSLRPLRVGIVGCGNVGAGLHLPAWLAAGDSAEVVALADPTEAALASAMTTAGLSSERCHLDPLELIARSDVDAVDVCTPQHLRREILLAAARAGKHILCEKPLAAVPIDAEAVVAAAAERGTTLALVHNYLWLPEIQAARHVIDSGEVGEVRTVIVNFLGVVDVPGNAAYESNWRHDPARAGGGVLIDMLHGIYLAEALLGEEIERVSAWIDSVNEGGVEDLALCRFETATKAGLVNIGWGQGPGGFEIATTAGRISIRYENGGTQPWAPLEHVLVTTTSGSRVELSGEQRRGDGVTISPALFETFDDVIRDFTDAVRTGSAPRAPGRDGQRILEATVAAYESAATGKLVKLPLDADDPCYRLGFLGLRELALPQWSPLRRTTVFAPAAVD